MQFRFSLWLFFLGMVLFCLINPASKLPYIEEFIESKKPEFERPNYIASKIGNGVMPKNESQNLHLRASEWHTLCKALECCLQVKPSERPSMATIQNILQWKDTSLSFPLNIHQGSAMEIEQEYDIGESLLMKASFVVPAQIFVGHVFSSLSSVRPGFLWKYTLDFLILCMKLYIYIVDSINIWGDICMKLYIYIVDRYNIFEVTYAWSYTSI